LQQAWRAQTEAGMLFNPLGWQRHITQPTLVIQGDADQVVDPGNAEVLAAWFPTPGCNGSTVLVTCSTGSSPSGLCVS
jgi:pimeloyl-ACP methyl ester carboxylesterase